MGYRSRCRNKMRLDAPEQDREEFGQRRPIENGGLVPGREKKGESPSMTDLKSVKDTDTCLFQVATCLFSRVYDDAEIGLVSMRFTEAHDVETGPK
jgi:hypothetical protein